MGECPDSEQDVYMPVPVSVCRYVCRSEYAK